MKSLLLGFVFACVSTFAMAARAQIYACTAPDGTRVFSDERCGPDAKVVTGIVTTKKRSAPSTPRAAKAPPKSEIELQALSLRCDAGDTQACNEWTHGGGPALLKANEAKLQEACVAGDLAACEERYCRDGATRECRARVRDTAPAAGDNWYLRTAGKRQPDGSTTYMVRCMPEGDLAIRELALTCASQASPERCGVADSSQRAATMSEAAAAHCARRR